MLVENQDNLVKEWDFLPYPEQIVLDYEIEQSTEAISDIGATLIKSRSKREYSQYSKADLRAWVVTFKERCGCCGETEQVLLVFHHKNPKEKTMNVPEMASRRFTKKAISAEIEKCIVLCWNCHVRIHAFDREEQKALN